MSVRDDVVVEWDYWCPAEGTHVVDRNELHVGIVRPGVEGAFEVEIVVAIVPPMAERQNEPMARIIRDWLSVTDWNEPDGWAAWCAAHGQVVRFPDVD